MKIKLIENIQIIIKTFISVTIAGSPQFMLPSQDLYASLVSKGKTISSDLSLEHNALFLKPFINQNTIVVDYGGGIGKFANLLKLKYSCKVIVYEPMNYARKIAKNSGIEVSGDLNEIPPVDIITLIEVLEHLPHPRSALNQIFNNLRSGGLIFLTTPNADSIAFKLKGKNWNELKKEEHIFIYKRLHILEMLSEAGFVSIKRVINPPCLSANNLVNYYRYFLDIICLGGGIRFTAQKP